MAIRKRTLPSGKVVWQMDYLDQTGKRHRRQFDKKAEAAAFIVTAADEVKRGVHNVDSGSIAVSEGGLLWIARCERNQRERTTIEQYKQHLNLHINPLLGTILFSRLTTPKVERFVDDLIAGGCSLALAKKVLVSLKSMISEVQRRGLVAQNVALPVKINSSTRGTERAVIPTKAELNLMLAKIDEIDPRWRPVLITAMFTGLRPSELRGLSWRHTDLGKSRTIKVQQRLDKYKELGAPKTRAGHRRVPLSPLVVETLRRWKLECPTSSDDLVFPNTLGEPMHITDLSRMCWDPLMKRCGLVDIVRGKRVNRYQFRHLRHVAASLFIASGVNAKRIQVVMGHSSVDVTFDIYGHLFDDPVADQAMASLAEKQLIS